MDKSELKGHLYTICDEIIKEIIEPCCKISGIYYDPWLTDIEMFTLNDDALDEEILLKIQEKYNLSEGDILHIDTWEPLIQIALFIYLEDERPQYTEMEE